MHFLFAVCCVLQDAVGVTDDEPKKAAGKRKAAAPVNAAGVEALGVEVRCRGAVGVVSLLQQLTLVAVMERWLLLNKRSGG